MLELYNLEIHLALYNLEIHQKKAKPDNHRLKTMVKRSFEQNLDHGTWRLEVGELSRTCWSRIRRNNVAFTKDEENVGNGKPTGSVRKETGVVSGTTGISVQNQRHRLLLLQIITRRKM